MDIKAKKYLSTNICMTKFDAVRIAERPLLERKTVVPVKEADPVLDAIYSLNSKTMLPNGDYVMYLSKTTSPELRTYIERALLQEHPVVPSLPDDQKDALFDYIRKTDESPADYAARITAFERQRLQHLAELKRDAELSEKLKSVKHD